MAHPLGRRVQHDPKSRSFAYRSPVRALSNVLHISHIGILDQGDLGSCHDADTEILTRAGWLPFPDLTLENEVATVDSLTRELTYEKPTRVINLSYSGDMYAVSCQGKDFRVTPDHSMLVRKWDERARTLRPEYEQVPMKDVGWYSGLMTSVVFKGSEHRDTYTIPGIPDYKRATQREDMVVPMRAWLNFLGIYLAEGTLLRPTAKSPYKIQLAAVKDREKTFVRGTLAALGIHALESKDRFTFDHGQVYRHMESLGLKGVYASEKFVPGFVFELPADDISALLAGHREGDGAFQNGCWTHYTSSPQLADDLQRLIFLAGGKTGMSYRDPRTATMKDGREVTGRHGEYAVRHLPGTLSSIERKREVRVEQYEGIVYCAEVPTHHTLVTRRNGKILISGNCTGNATVGALGCDPFYNTESGTLDQALAVKIYSLATTLDDVPGTWPPTDTGSSGLAAAKAAQQLGLLSGYQHAFNLADALAALQQGPVLTGIDWYSSFDSPDRNGIVSITKDAYVRGGHEVVLDGYDAAAGVVWCRNSWGPTWGNQGRFGMTAATWGQLLNAQGDATILVPNTQPAPVPAPKPERTFDDTDTALVSGLEPWAKGIVSRFTKAGRAVDSYRQWRTARGL